MNSPRKEAERGHYLVIGGHWADALDPLTVAIANWNKGEDGLYMCFWDRGVAYDGLGRYEDAVEDFSLAIALDGSAHIYHARAIAYCLAGRFHEALKDCELAYEKLPAEPYNAKLLSQLLSCSPVDDDRDGDRAHALAQSEYDGTPEHLALVACALAEMGQFADAIVLEEKILEFWMNDSTNSADDEESISESQRRLMHFQQNTPIRLSAGRGEWRKPW